jgi:hypothetical protein
MIWLTSLGYGGYGGYYGGGYSTFAAWQAWLTPIVQQLVYQAPVLIVWFIGVLLSLVALRTRPVALLCVIGAFLLTIASMMLDFSWIFLSFAMNRLYWPYETYESMLRLSQFAARFVESGSWTMLLLAVPAGRVQRPDADEEAEPSAEEPERPAV